MIYVETGSADVYFNFGLEYYFATEKVMPEPVFLFWRTTPTLMVGKYQNTLEEIDRAYAERHGIQVVRRLSGGGTIYTDMGGWQYTFITRGDAGEISFQKYISPVVTALRDLGAPVTFTGRNDLLAGGRKISGTAQYKLPDVTVHHGSLLFDTDIEQMVAATTVDSYKVLSKSIKSVRDRVANLKEFLPDMTADEFKEKMVAALLGGGSRYELTDDDLARIRALAAEHFSSWERRFGADPKCTITRSGRFAGGKVEFRLNVKKGIILEAAVSGDFFAAEKADALCAGLAGLPYEKAAIRKYLTDSGLGSAIYGVTEAELLGVVIE